MVKIRHLSALLPNTSSKTLVLVTGARQTGKTTLIKKCYPKTNYINLDSPENRDILRSISSNSWGKDVGNSIIDEAQKEPSIFEKIKFAYDNGSITFTVLLGSIQILMLKNVRESLAGRISIYELWPLLMSELISKNDTEKLQPTLLEKLLEKTKINSVLSNIPSILLNTDENDAQKKAEEHLLKWGGMPALLPLTSKEKFKWLKDYEYTYLERDLADLARLNDLEPFKKFQKLSSLRCAQLLNFSELARDTGIGVDTARRYLEYLRLSYQVILLQPYFENLTSSTVKTPKLYWIDTGIARQLSGNYGELSGQIYENMIVAEFYKLLKTKQSNVELYFYRTQAGLEADLIIKTQKGLFGVEIKSRNTVSYSDTKSLRLIAKNIGSKWHGGIVVYRGKEIKKVAEPNIWAIPSHRLFC